MPAKAVMEPKKKYCRRGLAGLVFNSEQKVRHKIGSIRKCHYFYRVIDPRQRLPAVVEEVQAFYAGRAE